MKPINACPFLVSQPEEGSSFLVEIGGENSMATGVYEF